MTGVVTAEGVVVFGWRAWESMTTVPPPGLYAPAILTRSLICIPSPRGYRPGATTSPRILTVWSGVKCASPMR